MCSELRAGRWVLCLRPITPLPSACCLLPHPLPLAPAPHRSRARRPFRQVLSHDAETGRYVCRVSADDKRLSLRRENVLLSASA